MCLQAALQSGNSATACTMDARASSPTAKQEVGAVHRQAPGHAALARPKAGPCARPSRRHPSSLPQSQEVTIGAVLQPRAPAARAWQRRGSLWLSKPAHTLQQTEKTRRQTSTSGDGAVERMLGRTLHPTTDRCAAPTAAHTGLRHWSPARLHTRRSSRPCIYWPGHRHVRGMDRPCAQPAQRAPVRQGSSESSDVA